MLKAIQRFLTLIFLIAGGVYLLYQGLLYNRARQLYSPGTMIAEVDVAGLSQDEARAAILEIYSRPVLVFHRQEMAEIAPQEAGFQIDMEAMLAAAEEQKNSQEVWQGYVEFVLGRALEPVMIPLQATHDPEAVAARLQTIATFLDKPAREPQLLSSGDTYNLGEAGYVTDIEASVTAVSAALYQPMDRIANLIVVDQAAPALDMTLLQENVTRLLEGFGNFGAVFVMDLQTGEEFSINGDVALSGMSILKIPIFVEAMRFIEGVPAEGSFEYELFYQTAVFSSNYNANQLLHIIAGENNTYLGGDIFTEALQKLGLNNTFMIVPYDVVNPPSYRPTTMLTPANTRTDIDVLPDPSRQTTAEDIGTVLAMLYYCAEGTGGFLSVYPGEITRDECQFIIDMLVLNVEGNIIRFGVPDGVPVSHKHGWGFTDHGDAGIIYSPGGDYVLYMYLSDPQTDWLSSDVSFPIMRQISRSVYNYFNFDNPNLEDPQVRAEREALALEAAEAAAAEAEAAATAEAEEAAGAGEATPTPTPESGN